MRFQILYIFEMGNVVTVDVHISHHVDKLSPFQTCNLSDQTCQKRVAGDIEGYTQSHVATSLVEDAVQFSRVSYLELAKQMALFYNRSTGGRAISLSWEGFQADMINLLLVGLVLISLMIHAS